MWADAILILVISICTALLGEGLTWLLVYRTEKYIRLKADIERQTKKLEKKKEAHGESTLVSRTNRHILGILNVDIVFGICRIALKRGKWTEKKSD